MKHVLMMALAASSGAGASAAAADPLLSTRKEGEAGQMTNKEQEQRDDAMKAEEQVWLLNAEGIRVQAARADVKALVEHSGYKEIASMKKDTEPGEMPPKMPGQFKSDNGVQTGDVRNAKPPEQRLEVSDPEAARQIEEKRATEAEDAARAATEERAGASVSGATGAPGSASQPDYHEG